MSFHKISLHQAALHDAAALAIVGAGTMLESFAGMVDGQALLAHCAKHHSIESYRVYLAQPTTSVFVATVEPGRAPVGYVMLTEPDLPLDNITSADLEIKRIYLFARFHGSGAGKLLLDHAIQTARAQNKSRLLLGVNAGNKLALAFYYRNAFTDVGSRKFQVGDILCDDLILARNLN